MKFIDEDLQVPHVVDSSAAVAEDISLLVVDGKVIIAYRAAQGGETSLRLARSTSTGLPNGPEDWVIHTVRGPRDYESGTEQEGYGFEADLVVIPADAGCPACVRKRFAILYRYAYVDLASSTVLNRPEIVRSWNTTPESESDWDEGMVESEASLNLQLGQYGSLGLLADETLFAVYWDQGSPNHLRFARSNGDW